MPPNWRQPTRSFTPAKIPRGTCLKPSRVGGVAPPALLRAVATAASCQGPAGFAVTLAADGAVAAYARRAGDWLAEHGRSDLNHPDWSVPVHAAYLEQMHAWAAELARGRIPSTSVRRLPPAKARPAGPQTGILGFLCLWDAGAGHSRGFSPARKRPGTISFAENYLKYSYLKKYPVKIREKVNRLI